MNRETIVGAIASAQREAVAHADLTSALEDEAEGLARGVFAAGLTVDAADVARMILEIRGVVRRAAYASVPRGHFLGERAILVEAFGGDEATADEFIAAIRVDQ